MESHQAPGHSSRAGFMLGLVLGVVAGLLAAAVVRRQAPPAREAVIQPPRVEGVPVMPAVNPPPPVMPGIPMVETAAATQEVWHGFYYYSLQPFEEAVAQQVAHCHFAFDACLLPDGSFVAVCKEEGNLGAAVISGKVDAVSGKLAFVKSYAQQDNAWRYEGAWRAERQRFEGTYGPNSGGFVLYRRALSMDELRVLRNGARPVAPDGTKPPPPAEKVPAEF